MANGSPAPFVERDLPDGIGHGDAGDSGVLTTKEEEGAHANDDDKVHTEDEENGG